MINTKKECLKFSFLKNHPSHLPFTDASNFETVPYLNAKPQNTLIDSSQTGISKENQNLFNNEQFFIEKQEANPQNLIVGIKFLTFSNIN